MAEEQQEPRDPAGSETCGEKRRCVSGTDDDHQAFQRTGHSKYGVPADPLIIRTYTIRTYTKMWNSRYAGPNRG